MALGSSQEDIMMGHMSLQHRLQACDRTPLLTVEGGPCKDSKRKEGRHEQASGESGEGVEEDRSMKKN